MWQQENYSGRSAFHTACHGIHRQSQTMRIKVLMWRWIRTQCPFSLFSSCATRPVSFFFSLVSWLGECHEVKKEKKGRETWWSYGPTHVCTRSDAKRWDRTIKEQPKGNAWAPTIPWGATISSLSVLSLQHGFYSTRALLPPFLG